ncbi:hypothetical protein M758_12G129200 [Ceratodon purpureus]|nr:hypothetical protein M758_12G129200 [Ceratodon purpureus]
MIDHICDAGPGVQRRHECSRLSWWQCVRSEHSGEPGEWVGAGVGAWQCLRGRDGGKWAPRQWTGVPRGGANISDGERTAMFVAALINRSPVRLCVWRGLPSGDE